MATNGKVPYGYGGPVPRDEEAPAPQPSKSCKSCACGKRVIGAGIIMFACLTVMFALILMRAPVISSGVHSLDRKQVGDLNEGLRIAAKDKRLDKLAAKHPEARGEAFWSAAVGSGLLSDSLVGRLVSLNSTTDFKADKHWIDESGVLPPNSCSYTAPRLAELKAVLQRTGEDRCVVLTFNARNWNNYPEHGVIVLWSDGVVGEYLTFDDAEEQFGITADEWADPAGKLFGKKAPFQHTYE